ncbi:uncharacterized protein LOC120943503 [Rana temporaria]|uniref:uncharacterized protein LOC120943503 n=1 Tax=Rana temporaria TaxID=8407 RepID=UPI001AAD95EF|nr:uncharacterized protein LOC120943503 [Rana temporaria]
MSHGQATFILDCARYCLTHNYFSFDDQYYLQVQGTAMGAKFAPSYANLAMGLWENRHICQNNPYLKHLIFYERFINDIIIIWDGAGDVIDDLVSHCNNNPYGLSFTSVTDRDKLAFLDLDLYHINNEIHAKNYFKPTTGNSLLHYKGCHYRKWKDNIPKGQFCRLRENCTKTSDYQSRLLRNKLKDKGYPESLVDQAHKRYLQHTNQAALSLDFTLTFLKWRQSSRNTGQYCLKTHTLDLCYLTTLELLIEKP